ncbi:hypothetical protein [Brunnivagina elsteri]|uniref:Uncharacterized protein n=1 Tax=Brunnivagina elsteri CCALA 953 TaxID=987040 RepID=A0A2A2TP73_9CYAN|nr:hypothetical protein [Calothrix elsteri]PAX60232.1 hypothetical protein CK510_02830 [Calothrix elsteri CCALA 953]
MALRIKVASAEFESATSDGWVDGLLQGKKEIWVYVELGTEQEYIPTDNDDPRTEYRLFRGCDVFYAKSQERLEVQIYEAEQLNVTVILYS